MKRGALFSQCLFHCLKPHCYTIYILGDSSEVSASEETLITLWESKMIVEDVGVKRFDYHVSKAEGVIGSYKVMFLISKSTGFE